MKISVVDNKGNKIEDITLNKDVFGITPNDTVLAQYVRVYLANQRQGTSSTKTRAEVSGIGRKPFKQKGTGNARVGSTRTPLWRHGGIVHGPKPKSWNLTLSSGLRRLATLSALSKKFTDNKVYVISDFGLDKPNTNDFKNIFKSLKIDDKTLVLTNDKNSLVMKSVNNIENVDVTFVGVLNTYEILNHKNILVSKEALLNLQSKYETK